MTHNQNLLADRLADCPGQTQTVLSLCNDRHAIVHVLALQAKEARKWLHAANFRIIEEGESKRTKSKGRYFVVEWQESDEERGRRVLWPFSDGG